MQVTRRGFVGAVGAASLSGLPLLQAQNNTADLVLFNGKIVTVDDAFSIRQAIVIKDGRILAVGGNELRNRYTAARSIDLARPHRAARIHGHAHPSAAATPAATSIFDETKSLAELQQQVSDKAKELGPGEWITGGDWDEYHFTEQRKPLRGDLDAAAPDNPVVLTRAGGHSSVGNSKALGTGGHQHGHARSGPRPHRKGRQR